MKWVIAITYLNDSAKSRKFKLPEPYPTGIYLFKDSNRNTRPMYEICSKLTIRQQNDVRQNDNATKCFLIGIRNVTLTLSQIFSLIYT